MDILGIDPGSLRTGWGLIREKSGVLQLIDCGIIRTQSEKNNFSQRLAYIYNSLCSIISTYSPEECAIEQVFTAQNPLAALKLGQSRGVAVASCAAFDLPVYDYAPTIVKKSIVGVGRAEKEQVAFMVLKILNAKQQKWPLDVTDALGVAICHLSQRRFNKLTQIQSGKTA